MKHLQFERWLSSMKQVILHHDFTVTVQKLIDTLNQTRIEYDAYGEDYNGYVLITPTFPKPFILWIMETQQSTIDDDTMIYEIETGELQKLYDQYLSYQFRMDKLKNILK